MAPLAPTPMSHCVWLSHANWHQHPNDAIMHIPYLFYSALLLLFFL